ncbi:MAG: DEAD/DEAH box helicase [Spirochaetae bacterium HGW-Spirochaetae-3]|nr:MAG: DEAD/DEAH box helicase [Spirochaetae bacterium HGW-Spirochaetae-3]
MPACLEALRHEGYAKPTPIQSASIPSLIAGRDLLGCAQTGTGKTAAFALPTIQRLTTIQNKRQPRKARSLIVAPTRELAIQIDVSFGAYGRKTELRRACVYGGVGKVPQIKAMERGVDVLVATPGRLLDLIGEGAIDLSAVEIVVFDEADRMLDMGFIHDVRKIIALLPKKRQTLLFSATMPSEIESLARSLLDDPVRVDIEPEKPTIELISQSLYYVEKGCKRDLLVHLIKELGVTRAVVFSRTKHGADRIAKTLHAAGIPSGVIHANKGQGNRTKTMEAFRAGETPVLVATDLAARGIDVDDISHVFNFDMPTEPETYVHRIGRTARAGASGNAISFCDTEEKRLLKQVERLLGTTIPVIKQHPYAGVRPIPTEEDLRDAMFDARSKERMRGRGQGRGRPSGASSRPAAARTAPGDAPRSARPPVSSQGGSSRAPDRSRAPDTRGRPTSDRTAPRNPAPSAGRDSCSPRPARPAAPHRDAPHRDAPRHETPSRSARDVRSVIDEITGRRS